MKSEPSERRPWRVGEVVDRREILGYAPFQMSDNSTHWHGRCWHSMPVRVVRDDPEVIVTYVETGAPFEFPDGPWPTHDRRHPWYGRLGWSGPGCLMLQRRDEHHAVWYRWDGPKREFRGWYVNIQTAPRCGDRFLDTLDLEVDLEVSPDGAWSLKDWDELTDRVEEGRFTPELADWVRSYATDIGRRLDKGTLPLDTGWCDWTPHWSD